MSLKEVLNVFQMSFKGGGGVVGLQALRETSEGFQSCFARIQKCLLNCTCSQRSFKAVSVRFQSRFKMFQGVTMRFAVLHDIFERY